MEVSKFMLFGLLGFSLLFAGCLQGGGSGGAGYQQPQSGEGRVVFAMKDAAADMSAVSKVEVTIDKVEVHSATEGWVTVSSAQHTYDLLQLKAQGSAALLGDAHLKEGTYQQMRLDISSVVVTDANGTHEAKLPSGEFKVVGDFVVKANSTSTALFDFIADDSLHVTGHGEYILAPVVQVETRENASAEVGSDNHVEITGGEVKSNMHFGMDADGVVRVNARIPANINLTIENGHVVVVGTGNGGVGVGIGAGGSGEGNASGNSANASGHANANASARAS